MAIQTPEAIEKLKRNWTLDPCYDIELTEGFEDHRDELLAYRLHMESEWRWREHARRGRRASELGIPGNYALLDFLEALERRLP